MKRNNLILLGMAFSLHTFAAEKKFYHIGCGGQDHNLNTEVDLQRTPIDPTLFDITADKGYTKFSGFTEVYVVVERDLEVDMKCRFSPDMEKTPEAKCYDKNGELKFTLSKDGEGNLEGLFLGDHKSFPLSFCQIK